MYDKALCWLWIPSGNSTSDSWKMCCCSHSFHPQKFMFGISHECPFYKDADGRKSDATAVGVSRSSSPLFDLHTHDFGSLPCFKVILPSLFSQPQPIITFLISLLTCKFDVLHIFRHKHSLLLFRFQWPEWHRSLLLLLWALSFITLCSFSF